VISLQTFRLQLRFLLPLAGTLLLAAWLAMPLMDQVTLRWFSRDLSSRGALVANALSESVAQALADGRPQRLQPLFARAVQDERLLAIGLCGDDDRLLQHTAAFPDALGCAEAARLAALAEPRLGLPGGPVHVGVHDVVAQRPVPAVPAASAPLVNPAPGVLPDEAVATLGLPPPLRDEAPTAPAERVARLVVLQDLGFIARRSQDTRRYLVGLIAALGGVIALITMVVAQLSWRGWVAGVRAILRGEGLVRPLARPGGRQRGRRAGQPAARAGALCRRPAGAAARHGGRVPPLAGPARRLDRRAPAQPAGHAAQRRPGDRGVQPRALHPRARRRRRHRRAAPGQRPGDGGGAGDARLLGHLGGAWQRQCRPRRGRCP
jgi:hypothetical protein